MATKMSVTKVKGMIEISWEDTIKNRSVNFVCWPVDAIWLANAILTETAEAPRQGQGK